MSNTQPEALVASSRGLADVNIYHGAFEADDPKKLLFNYTSQGCFSDTAILNRAFMMFNVDPRDLMKNDSYIAKRYRNRARLRSLSVGDIVEIDGNKYRCMPEGWRAETPNS